MDPTFLYTFEFILEESEDCALIPGDFLTFYDVWDLSAGDDFFDYLSDHPPTSPGLPNLWIVSTPSTGSTPIGESPPDDPNLENVTFTYVGPMVVGPVGVDTSLGFFTFVIEQPFLQTNLVFASQINGGIGEDCIIVDTIAIERVIPEPSTVVTLGLGVVVLGAFGLSKRKRKA
jgi:hypothetical protein